MTQAVTSRPRGGALLAGGLGVLLAAALALVVPGTATAQDAGTNLGSCTDKAWQNLNNCYMSGSGGFHDFLCALKFEMDLAECFSRSGREIYGQEMP